MWAIGEPSGPIENGTTYIVRPSIEPRKQLAQQLAHLLRVAPVVRRAGVLLALRADERAVLDAGDVAGIRQRQVGVRALGVGQPLEGAGVDQRLARARSYSSADPSHQWIASGCVRDATSSTQARSFAWLVWAGVLCGTAVSLTTGGTPPPKEFDDGRGILPKSGPERGDNVSGGTLARGHRAVHVAAPDGRGLGPGPVQRADRRPQRRAELGPGPGGQCAAVAAAGPFLVGPRPARRSRPGTRRAGRTCA